jgi:CubicO group peptidase (beta-lactamase class C family)
MRLAILVLMLLMPGVVLAGDEDWDSLSAIFEPWDSLATPGCAVGIAKDGQTHMSRAFGAADLELDVANKPTTLFELGSVSKQFTAAAILILARDGRLKLTDNIRNYLPEMPRYGADITIDHLLTHTSGIRDWGILDELAGWGRTTRVMTNDDALAIIVRQRELDFLPGHEFSYTNSGFVLLAIIVERVTGQSLQEYSQEMIFGPLGMTSTQWRDNFRQVVKGRSVAYMNTEQGYLQTMPFENVYGDAGILTNVQDLLTWNNALSDRKFGDFVSTELERPAVLNNGRPSSYAHGLWVKTRNGAKEISHAGGIGAYRAWLGRFPEHNLSIAVACNAGDPDYTFGGDYFGYKIADLYLPGAVAGDGKIYSSKAESRTGLFVSEVTGMPVTLAQEKDVLRYNGSPLVAISDDSMALGGDSQVIFESDDRFRVEAENGNVEAYAREPVWTPENTELEAYAGLFYSDEIETTYEIKKESAGLALYIKNRPGIVFQLEPAYRDAFVYDTRLGQAGGLVRFYRDDDGIINRIGLGWRIGRVRDLQFNLIADN